MLIALFQLVTIVPVTDTYQFVNNTCEEFLVQHEDISSIRFMDVEIFKQCLLQVGQAEMSLDQSHYIWTISKEYFGSVNAIPQEVYKNMGWAIGGISLSDFENITLNDIDIVETFGQFRNLNEEQLTAVLTNTRTQWADKVSPDMYSEYDLIALNQILCAFNRTDILLIHPDAYKGAALHLGRLVNCTKEVLQSLSVLAMDNDAFGSPMSWSIIVVDIIGVVVSGMNPEDFNKIPKSSLISYHFDRSKGVNTTNSENDTMTDIANTSTVST